NFTEVLDSEMSFQVSDQIIIYTSQRSGIVGVWIYEETDRARVPKQLSVCCADLNAQPAGRGVLPLYPQSAEEVSEFRRMYPRSRSNSRKDGGADIAGTNTLSAIINQTRQQQQQQQQHAGGRPGASNYAGDPAAAAELAGKLQAIGLDVSGGAGAHPQGAAADGGASAVYMDPAIIMARKSVNPQDMSANGRLAGKQYSPASTDASDGASFKSPLPMPSTHGQPMGSNAGGHAAHAGPMLQGSSPVLHPVQVPFLPSTITTPLPSQGLPTQGLPTGYPGPPFWGPPPRSVHASPVPVGYGGVPPMPSFTPIPVGHPGVPQIPQPPVHMVHPQPGAPVNGNGGHGTTPSVTQNLAEQLVSLVRQRMNTVRQNPGASPAPRAPDAQPQAGLPASAVKAQRDYCREWLIRVIQADDELVDAFAQRFPPPIATPQPQYPPLQ
ncbi:hypothetical protein IWQ56_003590, partial [Coemansia nantahalensis]